MVGGSCPGGVNTGGECGVGGGRSKDAVPMDRLQPGKDQEREARETEAGPMILDFLKLCCPWGVVWGHCFGVWTLL